MEELHTIPTMEVQHPLKKMFINEKIAKILKEKGFNEPCFAYYRLNHVNDDYMFHIVGEYSSSNNDWYIHYVGTGLTNSEMQRNPIGRLKQCFTAPLYQQVVKFFREKHGLIFWVEFHETPVLNIKWSFHIHGGLHKFVGNSYEECLEAAIIEALKLI